MNKYEITLLTTEDLKEAPVKKEIEGLGGKVLTTSVLGERQLAYPIKKQTTGIYTTVVFEMEGEKVLELNKKLVMKTEILRQLIIAHKAVQAAKPAKPKETLAPETEITVPAETEIIPTPVETPEPEKTPAKAVKVAPEKEAKKSPDETPEKPAKPAKKTLPKTEIKSQKVQEEMQKELSADDRLKALDKKLDELLKD